jgi:ribosomal protein L11 methyltransferase
VTEARFTLTLPARPLDTAQDLASAVEDNLRLDPLAITINETDEANALWEVVLYFESEGEARAARTVTALAAGIIAPLPGQDWVRKSLAGLAPVIAGRFFLHGAHDRLKRRAGGISLEIDAGTAFGTGHHGTTEGCLVALDRILKRRRPQRILDVGCGTGVLAIAAARATGRPTVASDIDPEAVRVTIANAALNGVKPQLSSVVAAGLGHPRIAANAPYDLIFANILARPLVSLTTGLARALAPGGELILSGLTLDQMRWIEATYQSRGLILAGRIRRGNWAALIFTRAKRKRHPGGRTPGHLLVSGSRRAGWEFDV